MDTNAGTRYWPDTGDIRDAVGEEIAAAGGTVADVYDDGARLFFRAVLPVRADVRPGDRLQAGVAVRTAGPEVLVHPYTFREVCTNGAIRAHALETRRVERVRAEGVLLPTFDGAMAVDALRRAVRACASREVFAAAVTEMRSGAEVEADDVLELLPMLAFLTGGSESGVPRRFLHSILGRFDREPDPDRSVFGVINAVTSVARDTRDPEVRWRLEEVGGRMPALIPQLTRQRVKPGETTLVHAHA